MNDRSPLRLIGPARRFQVRVRSAGWSLLVVASLFLEGSQESAQQQFAMGKDLEAVGSPGARKVFSDYFMGAQNRPIAGVTNVWRLYDTPHVDFDFPRDGTLDDFFPRVCWSGDAYVTADKKEVSATFYPIIGIYDTRDPDLNEYHILLAKSAGIDGFFGEWQITNLKQFQGSGGDCTAVPNAGPSTNHSTLGLISMAQVARQFGFTIGVTYTSTNLFTWYPYSTLCSSATPTALRSIFLEQGAWDLDYILDNVYSVSGPHLGGRPMVLLWSTDDSPTTGSARWFDTDDIWEFRKKLARYGQDPFLFGRDNHGRPSGSGAGLIDAALANPEVVRGVPTGILGVEGFFSWHRFTNPCSGSCSPWTDVVTPADQVNYIDNFLNGQGAILGAKALKSSGKITAYMPSVTPHIDNHKGLSWSSGYKNRTPRSDAAGSTLSQMFAVWPDSTVPAAENTDLGFVDLFNDPQENAGIEPTREWGYRDIEECATRIAEWKGLPAPDLALLRLPERLYGIRKGIGLIFAAIARQSCGPSLNPPPSPGLNVALDAAVSRADAAAMAISSARRIAAESELSAAEANLSAALSQMEATRIDVFWQVQKDAGGNYLDVTSGDIIELLGASGVSALGKDGRTLASPLYFDVTGATGDALQHGQFVGTITIEFLDTNGRESDPELYENVRILVDSPPDVGKVILDYRSRESDLWRAVQCDLVNGRFGNGLSFGADIRVEQLVNAPARSVPRGLHSLRIEGHVYRASCWIGETSR